MQCSLIYCRLDVLSYRLERLLSLYRSKHVFDEFYKSTSVIISGWRSAVYKIQKNRLNGPAITQIHYAVLMYYCDVIMSVMASQITSFMIVYSNAYSGADQRKHQSSASLAFVRIIHRWPVNSPHKWSVMRKMFPFDDFIIANQILRL